GTAHLWERHQSPFSAALIHETGRVLRTIHYSHVVINDNRCQSAVMSGHTAWESSECTERGYRGDVGSAQGWQPGGKRNQSEQERNRGGGPRQGKRGFRHATRQHGLNYSGESDSKCGAGGGEDEGFAKDHAADIVFGGADRHSQSDLAM